MEMMSLRQCLNVLGKYAVYLVCPEGLDTTVYDEVAGKKLVTERFDAVFFKGIEGYNHLMRSHAFYQRFKAYDYLLIHQLDAWVFRDELEAWCSKGYDYVGAPWFEGWLSHEEGCDFMCVGNGGLSLRRVEKFLSITKPSSRRLRSIKQLLSIQKSGASKYLRCLMQYFSNSNRADVFSEQHKDRWEDVYFCYDLRASRLALRVPECTEAAKFSIETSPEYIFNEINGRKLPFGCHAWQRYQYEDFWKKIITQEKS